MMVEKLILWLMISTFSAVSLALFGYSRYQAGYDAAVAEMAQPCPDLPELQDSKGATLLLWAFDVVGQYQDCQAKHQGLVAAWDK